MSHTYPQPGDALIYSADISAARVLPIWSGNDPTEDATVDPMAPDNIYIEGLGSARLDCEGGQVDRVLYDPHPEHLCPITW